MLTRNNISFLLLRRRVLAICVFICIYGGFITAKAQDGYEVKNDTWNYYTTLGVAAGLDGYESSNMACANVENKIVRTVPWGLNIQYQYFAMSGWTFGFKTLSGYALSINGFKSKDECPFRGTSEEFGDSKWVDYCDCMLSKRKENFVYYNYVISAGYLLRWVRLARRWHHAFGYFYSSGEEYAINKIGPIIEVRKEPRVVSLDLKLQFHNEWCESDNHDFLKLEFGTTLTRKGVRGISFLVESMIEKYCMTLEMSLSKRRWLAFLKFSSMRGGRLMSVTMKVRE